MHNWSAVHDANETERGTQRQQLDLSILQNHSDSLPIGVAGTADPLAARSDVHSDVLGPDDAEELADCVVQ